MKIVNMASGLACADAYVLRPTPALIRNLGYTAVVGLHPRIPPDTYLLSHSLQAVGFPQRQPVEPPLATMEIVAQ